MACRQEHRNNNNLVPCERNEEQICGLTKYHIKDNRYLIDPPLEVKTIAEMWADIVSLSNREQIIRRIKKGKNIESMEIYLPTLEKLEYYFKIQNWQYMPFTEYEALHFIKIFHSTYTGIVRSG